MKLELFNNAMHSIYHALEQISIAERILQSDKEFDHEDHMVHWKNESGNTSFFLEGYSKPTPIYRYKFVVLNLILGLELVLKSYIQEKTSSSIFKGKNGYTINLHEALKITLGLNSSLLSESEKTLIENASNLRNQMQHYEFSYELSELRRLSRELYLVISKIANSLFSIDLVKYFEYDHWSENEDPIYEIIKNVRNGAYG
jgi:hypothetical protein